MPYAPTLTPRSDMAPVPRMEVLFSTVPAAAERATVYRVLGSRTYAVRAGVKVYAAGGFSLVDTEIPFNAAAGYRAEFFDVSGVSLGFSDGSVGSVVFDGTVIHQPTTPSRAVSVMLRSGAAAVLSRPFFGASVQPKGRSVPVWVGSGRSGLIGVDVSSVTLTPEDEEAFYSVFGGYDDVQLPIVCFRTSAATGLPQPFFGVVRDPQRVGFDTHLGGNAVEWVMQADEVAPPASAIVIALLTYADVEAVSLTYQGLEDAYLTYLDMESDYTIAGTG